MTFFMSLAVSNACVRKSSTIMNKESCGFLDNVPQGIIKFLVHSSCIKLDKEDILLKLQFWSLGKLFWTKNFVCLSLAVPHFFLLLIYIGALIEIEHVIPIRETKYITKTTNNKIETIKKKLPYQN